jgi:hypothetical protein
MSASSFLCFGSYYQYFLGKGTAMTKLNYSPQFDATTEAEGQARHAAEEVRENEDRAFTDELSQGEHRRLAYMR